MKRVFIIHGWGGDPEESWFPWMKSELEKKGVQVFVPAMPDTDHPKIETWVPFLSELLGTPDPETFFVGHSIGCQTILRYLETLPEDTKIGGAVFVGGWYNVRNIDDEEDKEIVGPWVITPRNDEKIKKIIGGKAVAIFSDNDPYVSLDNKPIWEEKVGAKTILEKGKGHFNDDSNVTELPSALQALLEMI